MKTENITDKDLRMFCEWFAGFHGTTTEPAVITTCMCGYFHTYTKNANKLLTRCKRLKMVVKDKDRITIMSVQHAVR